MIRNLEICYMQEQDIDEAKKIWLKQYELYCSDISFPLYWKEETSLLERFLRNKIKSQSAIVAKYQNNIVGFLSYDSFPFNGEMSVFCPAIGHSAIEEFKESIYQALYSYLSQEWVKKNIFNHMWTIFYNDIKLKSILFDLGYGSYLIDAFNDCKFDFNENTGFDIKKATINDSNILFELVKESNEYYAASPLFLKRDELTLDEIKGLILNNNVYIAWDQDEPIGFINLSISQTSNLIDLTVANCGLIDEIGVYIKSKYRNRKIGIMLLKNIFDYCKENDVPYIHVDFETSNLYANKFWRKYFTPMLLSLRRTINKNIND